jgi:hypothetical protein
VEVENLAELADSSGEFYETYNAQTGVPDGGWQTGSHWASEPDQTWSATAYLRMVYDDLFGMNFTTSGITFQPTLPAGWGNVTRITLTGGQPSAVTGQTGLCMDVRDASTANATPVQRSGSRRQTANCSTRSRASASTIRDSAPTGAPS